MDTVPREDGTPGGLKVKDSRRGMSVTDVQVQVQVGGGKVGMLGTDMEQGVGTVCRYVGM